MTLLHQAAQKAVEALKLCVEWNASRSPKGDDSILPPENQADHTIGGLMTALEALESALQQQEVPSTAVIPPAPPECETEDEKTAFSFGYWQGLHAARKGQEVPREPVAVARPLTSEEEENAWNSITEQGCSCCTGAVRLFCRLNGITLSDAVLAASPSTTRQQEVGSGWRSIEGAPKDGTLVALYGKMPDGSERVTFGEWITPPDKPRLVYCDGFAPEEVWEEWDAHWASWDGGFTEENPPTHWMPLPAAPSTPENADGGPHG